MKRNLGLLSILLFTGLVFSVPAHAVTTEDIGTSCSTEAVGTSTMTSDGKNIVICLKNDSGDQVWKGMTSGGGSGTFKFVAPLAGTMSGYYCTSCQKTGCHAYYCSISAYYCPSGSFWVSGSAESCANQSTAPYGTVCHTLVVPFGSTAPVSTGYQNLQCGSY